MKLNPKDAFLFEEMLTLMNSFDDTTALSVATLKVLQNIVCIKYLANDKSKKCGEGCPLNTLGLCREITNYYSLYEKWEEEDKDEEENGE